MENIFYSSDKGYIIGLKYVQLRPMPAISLITEPV